MIVSISKLRASSCAYYFESGTGLTPEPGESDAQPMWQGGAAEHLGLSGAASRPDLERMLEGFDPTGAALTKSAGDASRQHGWDLCWSADKSVSLVWAFASEAHRAQIQRLLEEVVEHVLSQAEETLLLARAGAGGNAHVKGKLIGARFTHFTSRAGDPQLHVHVLIPNLALRGDGTTVGLLSRSLYRARTMLGALATAELARRLEEELGVQFEKKDGRLQVRGASDELLAAFSTRRRQILEAMEEDGVRGGKSAALAALKTRGPKVERTFARAWIEWLRVLIRHKVDIKGLGPRFFPAGLREHKKCPPRIIYAEARACAVRLSEQYGSFSGYELAKATARRFADGSASSGAVLASVHSVLEDHRLIHRVTGETGLESRFITNSLLQVEREAHSLAKKCAQVSGYAVSQKRIDAVIHKPQFRSLGQDQRDALHWIAGSPGQIRCVSGPAGTGKTFLLRAANEVWKKEGLEVIGCSVSARAAQELEKGSGIPSMTLHRLLAQRGEGPMFLARSRVIVLDEAAMVGTRDFARLLKKIRGQDVKLVLVGDSKQLQPIPAGGVFKEMCGFLGVSELRENRRQYECWMTHAAEQVREGDIEGALKQYALAKRLHLLPSQEKAMRSLVSSWSDATVEGGSVAKILAGTREEVSRLNELAQGARRSSGSLGRQKGRAHGKQFSRGDEVVILENDYQLGVLNGELGRIVRIATDPLGRLIGVAIEVGEGSKKRIVKFDPRKGPDFDLGYCLTVHKAQGMTMDKCFVLLGGPAQTRQSLYVQLTRSREETRLFASAEVAGASLARIAKTVSRDQEKRLVHEWPAIGPEMDLKNSLRRAR